MSETILATASEKQVWMTKYFQEYVRQSGFMPYMTNADLNKGGIILTRYELQDSAGKTINIPFIGRLKSGGVTGSTVLDGNEEELTNYDYAISIDWRRNAVRVPKSTSFKTEINLLNAARDMLKVWEAEKVRDDIIKAFMSFNLAASAAGGTDTVVNADLATVANKNAWAVANKDRTLYGSLLSNYNATFATALANVAAAAKASAANMSLAKRIAKLADPHIRPYMTEDGREFYVAFHGSRSFRDIKADATIVSANTNARAREGSGMDKNPIFQDGDIIYDGIIHREVPEIDAAATASGIFDGAGTAAADVRPVFVCGGGAVGIAWGQEPTPRTDFIKDYGFRPGVAIEELLGVKKISYQGKQNGVVTAFVGAAADS